jgi:hypothetical protein
MFHHLVVGLADFDNTVSDLFRMGITLNGSQKECGMSITVVRMAMEFCREYFL